MSFTLALMAASAVIDLAVIDRAVADFSGEAAMPVDRRLRLDPCSSPLALSWRTARRETVVVECRGAPSWRLFVPVTATGPASAPAAIGRGDAITVAISGAGFSISQPGEAMESGSVGSWIRVKTAAKQPMRALVMRPGMVSVPLP